ncbi:MAG: GNAT family N-acetyltransferase [Anaerolineales bacterium]|nr:MAG: GNAT family N-acetyltransferase [Anaerolineales bacterium]
MAARESSKAELNTDIRAATWRDFLPIYRLEKRCFRSDAWPWIDVLAALIFPETVRYVAEVDEEIVGFIVGDRRRQKDMGWVATLAVAPAFRRRGIARRLLQTCEAGLGTSRIRLSLRESNREAYDLYLKDGYAEVDRWQRYYRNREDAIVMEKNRRTP